jgi:hypothetical protein
MLAPPGAAGQPERMRRREAIGVVVGGVAGGAVAGGFGQPSAAAPAGSPGRRAGHALAYHAGARAVCLIGGDAEGRVETQERTWLWNGRAWTLLRTAGAPPAASLVAAAGDIERQSVLAFGGYPVLGPKQYGPPSGDLWELGADLTWRQPPAAGSPPGPRHHHAIAFDAGRGRLVLYGGIDASGTWHVDVWEWDRERWHRIATPSGPGERAHHAMAYDSGRRRIVLRGGTRSDKAHPPETWEWDGTAWQEAAAGGPGPGNGYRMAYDAARGVTVLFGGDTCLWDGRTWTQVSRRGDPAARSVHALAYDPDRACVVLHGGTVGRGTDAADTWEWNGAAWTERTPAGAADAPKRG